MLTPLARHLLSRVPAGVDVPRYGSTEWDELDEQDPRRAAAVITAAEAWRRHCSPEQVAEDLRQQLVDEEEAVWRRIRELSWDLSASGDWEAIARRPTYAELCDRRGEPERAASARKRWSV